MVMVDSVFLGNPMNAAECVIDSRFDFAYKGILAFLKIEKKRKCDVRSVKINPYPTAAAPI